MEPQKTVVYVITKATWGGAQKYVFDLISHSKAYGYAPVLAYGEHGILAERVEALQVPTYPIASLGRDISFFKELAAKRELTALFTKLKPDVVHLNSSKAGYVGALAAKAANVPRIVFTAHGWAFTEPRSFLAKKFFEVLQRKTVMLSDVTIAVSRFIKKQTERWHLRAGKVVLVHLGIGTLPYLSKESARAVLATTDPTLEDAELLVGTIAELHPNKGIDIGIRAWKKVQPKNAAWVVLGDGQEKKTLTEQAVNEPSIHFLGFMPDAWKYVKAFDLFVLPSRTEALGYVVLEAVAAGVPVIASDFGGAQEALGDAPADMLFPSENADALAEKMNACLRAAETLAEKGNALKKYVEQNFSLGKMLDATFEQYKH